MADRYRLIVDTESYAGNFERELVGYATGQVGECGVGRKEAGSARADLPLEDLAFWADHLIHATDDDAVARPAQLWPTPSWFNHGHGEHFRDTPEGKALGLIRYREAVARFAESRVQNCHPIDVPMNQARREEDLRAAQVLTEVRQFPAYLSVAIVLDAAPIQALVDRYTKRVQDYWTDSIVSVPVRQSRSPGSGWSAWLRSPSPACPNESGNDAAGEGHGCLVRNPAFHRG